MDQECSLRPNPVQDDQPELASQDTPRSYEDIHIMLGATAEPMLNAIDDEKPLPPTPTSLEYPSTSYISFEDFDKAGLEQTVPPNGNPGPTSVQQREYEPARDIEQRGQELARRDREQLRLFRRYQRRVHSHNVRGNRTVNDPGNTAGRQMDGNDDQQTRHDATDALTHSPAAGSDSGSTVQPSRGWKGFWRSIFDCTIAKAWAAICGRRRGAEGDLEGGNGVF